MQQLEQNATKPKASRNDFESDLAISREHWLKPLVLMVVATVVMFHPVVFGGKTLLISVAHCASIMPGGAYCEGSREPTSKQFCSDPWAESSQGEAWLRCIGNSFIQRHKFPLWNPYAGCGMPLLANMQSQILFPLTTVASLFLWSWTYEVFALSRLLLAGLFTYFALKMLIPDRPSALVGAVGYMFTGYIVRNLNMADISVDVSIPALILGIELVLQRTSVLSVAVCAGSVALVLLGGMPEISFIALAFSGAYVLVRLLTLENWHVRVRMFGLIAVAYFAGLMLSLPQVLPFLEYMRLSDNLHDPRVSGHYSGLEFDQDWRRGLLSYIFPVAWAEKCYARGVYGAALGFLALSGAVLALFRLKERKPNQFSVVMMVFFAASFLTMLLKRFGSPLVQWFGSLPVANMVLYAKYDEVLMALCVSALAAFAASLVRTRSVKPRLVIVLAVVFWLFASLLYLLYRGAPMVAGFDLPKDLKYNMLLALGALSAVVAVCLSSYKSERIRRVLPMLIVIPLVFETYSGYMSQTFYGKQGIVERRADPFQGAPYIDFLKKRINADARVIGLDGVLHPNWSGVFQIQDVRYSDALCPLQYNSLIAGLLPNSGFEYKGRGFSGEENSTYNHFNLRRFCELASVNYVVSVDSLSERGDLIVSAAQKSLPYAGAVRFCYVPGAMIDGRKQTVLFQHPRPDSSRYPVKLVASVPVADCVLEFDFIRNPDVACPARTTPVHGLVVVEPTDRSQPAERYEFVNAEKSKLHATHYRFDLTKFAGKQVAVSISSSHEPGDECSWEWVGWKKLCFPSDLSGQCIYDREVKVYELSRCVPRAAIFHGVQLLENEQEVLKAMQKRTFAPLKTVLVPAKDLPSEVVASLSALKGEQLCRPARICRYESDEVEIAVPSTDVPALLLLTDNYYPGWNAYVDGKESRILRGNNAFRAVLLPAGAKSVVFKYSPWSFKVGIAGCLATILALFFAWRRRSRLIVR